MYYKKIFSPLFQTNCKAVIVPSMNDADYVMASEDKATEQAF